MTRRYENGSRAPVVALMYGLAVADEPAIAGAIEELRLAAPDHVDRRDSPYAAVEHRALSILDKAPTDEFGRAVADGPA